MPDNLMIHLHHFNNNCITLNNILVTFTQIYDVYSFFLTVFMANFKIMYIKAGQRCSKTSLSCLFI